MTSFYSDTEANALGLYGPDQTPTYSNPANNDFTSSGVQIPQADGGNSSLTRVYITGSPPKSNIGSNGAGTSTPLSTPSTGSSPTTTGSSNDNSSSFTTGFANDILIRGALIFLAVILIGAGLYLLGKEVVTTPTDTATSAGRKAVKGLAFL